MALVTEARAQANALLATVGSTELGYLNDAASQMIVNWCDTEFEAADTTTEETDGNGLYYIFTQNIPITALTSVIITEDGGSTTTILAANLQYDAATGMISFNQDNNSSYGHWPKGMLNLKIAYSYGYDTIPAPVQEACVQTMARMYGPNMATNNPLLLSEKMGEYAYSRVSKITDVGGGAVFTPMIENLLLPYKHYKGV